MKEVDLFCLSFSGDLMQNNRKAKSVSLMLTHNGQRWASFVSIFFPPIILHNNSTINLKLYKIPNNNF